MDEMIPVNILIGDRNYRVRVAPSDEEKVRKTAKMINDKLVEFKTQFAGKDMQDYIAMVIIWYATQSEAGGGGFLSETLGETLTQFEKQLDKALEEK